MKLVVSTDSIGINCNPAHFHEVWGFVLQEKQFAGVEMLAWRGIHSKIEAFKKAHIPICGMHGKTGGMREATKAAQLPIYFLMQEVFAPIKEEVKEVQENKLQYLLVHVEYARELLEKKQTNIISEVPMFIENDTERSSHTKTLSTIKTLSEHKVRAQMVFDIVHCVRSFNGPFDESFRHALTILTHISPPAIHLPVGTYLSDSLPWDTMTDEQFTLLANTIKKVSPKFLIIENQQERKYSYLSPKSARKLQRTRNEHIIEKLKEIGILQ